MTKDPSFHYEVDQNMMGKESSLLYQQENRYTNQPKNKICLPSKQMMGIRQGLWAWYHTQA